jgi:hypothetical protein
MASLSNLTRVQLLFANKKGGRARHSFIAALKVEVRFLRREKILFLDFKEMNEKKEKKKEKSQRNVI